MSKLIDFEGLHNVRDLGGMTCTDGKSIKSGRLFRSDQLFFASESDKQLLNDLGLRVIVDFRSGVEREDKPDPAIERASNVHLPIIKDVRAGITRDENSNKRIMQMIMSGQGIGLDDIDKYMNNMYREFVTDPYANAQYAQFVDEVTAALQAGGAALWHCTAGKDRAGFATVILLETLGVPRDDIVADYLQTNECLTGVTAQLVSMLSSKVISSGAIGLDDKTIETIKAALDRFFCADERFLKGAYDAADEHFGSFSAFVEQGLGIDASKRQALQELCLE